MSMTNEIADAGTEYDRKVREILKKYNPNIPEVAEGAHLVVRKMISLVATIIYNLDENCHDTVIEIFRRRLIDAWKRKKALMAADIGADEWRSNQ